MIKFTSTEEIQYSDLSELESISERIIDFAGDVKIWTFEGEMGAGKTTMIKAICRKLGVQDNVTSPTFSLVNEYCTDTQNAVYHFDFYRLKEETEALDIGVEEYFYSDSYCFIEWPSKIQSLLPLELIEINISIDNNSRIIKLFKNTQSHN